MKLPENFESILRSRLQQLHDDGAETIGDMLNLQLVMLEPEQGEVLLRCATAPWMRNLAGTLHGGLCATVVDQAMGCVAWCAKPGEGVVATISLQLNYHRPLIPGEDVLVRIRVMSVTKSLIQLSCEACVASAPEKLCLSGGGTFFYKPKTV